MHCSTSVNYAVIYKKPIIILDSIVWSSVDWIVNQIYSLTTTLGVKSFFMEDFDKYVLTDNHIPQNINEYYNNYIKEDKTPNDPFWEIVFHTIYNKQ